MLPDAERLKYDSARALKKKQQTFKMLLKPTDA